jgi:hypothetical protein
MAETSSHDRFIAAIKRAIDAEVGHIVESEMEDMVEKVKRRVRERVGAISGSVFQEYSMSRNGSDVVITVKFNDKT